MANFLMRQRRGAGGSAVVTPLLSRGILPGVRRAWAIDHLRGCGELVIQRPIEPSELARADELFITRSLVGVRALTSIDRAALPPKAPTGRKLGIAYAGLGRASG